MLSVASVMVLGLLACAHGNIPFKHPWQGTSMKVDEWTQTHHSVHPTSGETTVSFNSLPLNMLPGQIMFTDPNSTPLKFPTGRYSITSFTAEIVDQDNKPTPLTEVYLHHWLVYNRNRPNGGYCGTDLSFIFGVGGESRHTSYRYPTPYGYIVQENDKWAANIHILNTRYVPDIKHCIECHCPNGGGGFQCCDDGMFCNTTAYPPNSMKTYYLRYTITYVPVDETTIPITMYVMDVTSCKIEYDVPQCKNAPCIDARSFQRTIPKGVDIVWMVGHLHEAATNLTSTILSATTRTPLLQCISQPVYGNGGKNVSGNETGYVVGMNTCFYNPPVVVPAGSIFNMTAYYHNDPYHDAVMALTIYAGVNHAQWAELAQEFGYRLSIDSMRKAAEQRAFRYTDLNAL